MEGRRMRSWLGIDEGGREINVWMGKLPSVPKLVCDTQIKSVFATKVPTTQCAVLHMLVMVQ